MCELPANGAGHLPSKARQVRPLQRGHGRSRHRPARRRSGVPRALSEAADHRRESARIADVESTLTRPHRSIASSHRRSQRVGVTSEEQRTSEQRNNEPARNKGRAMDDGLLRRVLIEAPGDPVCDTCLAAICDVSPEEVRSQTATLLTDSDEFERGWVCASCHRYITSVYYRAKCAHCSVRLQGGDKGFRMGEEIFHVACLRRLVTDDSIRLSRALGRRSRRLIEQSRRRVREGNGWPPLESP